MSVAARERTFDLALRHLLAAETARLLVLRARRIRIDAAAALIRADRSRRARSGPRASSETPCPLPAIPAMRARRTTSEVD